jgi:hypothetical protein
MGRIVTLPKKGGNKLRFESSGCCKLKWLKLKNLTIRDFGPFEGSHVIKFPESGLCLIKGKVVETGDGSGAGKSFLLKAIAHLFGGCKDSANDLQSWFTESAPEVTAEIETQQGVVVVGRHKGLSVASNEKFKGKAASAELDKIFGMDEESRSIVTYRGQRQPGLFLSLSDEKKKSFLATLLGLTVYEIQAKAAQDKITRLEREYSEQSKKVEYVRSQVSDAQTSLEAAQTVAALFLSPGPEKLSVAKECIGNLKKLIQLLQQEIDKVKSDILTASEKELANIRAKISAVNKQSEPIEVGIAKKEISTLRSKADSLKIQITTIKVFTSRKVGLVDNLTKAQYRNKILQEQTCSECKRVWVGPDAEVALQENVGTIATLQQKIVEIDAALLELAQNEAELFETNRHLATEESHLEQVSSSWKNTRQQELLALEQEEKNFKTRLVTEFRNSVSELTKTLEANKNALECATIDERKLVEADSQAKIKLAVVSERESQVANLGDRLDVESRILDEKKNSLCLEKDIFALVGRQGFLGSIVEEVLVEIAAVANSILSQVANVRHLTIEFETEKEAVTTGNITARIVPVIYSRGRRVPFDSGVSGGQHAAIDLAVDLAVGEVVSRRRGSWPSWLILDECFDGLGGVAKESCLEMLQNYASDRLVLIVDHSSEFQGLFHSVVEIEMVDGRSRIVV